MGVVRQVPELAHRRAQSRGQSGVGVGGLESAVPIGVPLHNGDAIRRIHRKIGERRIGIERRHRVGGAARADVIYAPQRIAQVALTYQHAQADGRGGQDVLIQIAAQLADGGQLAPVAGECAGDGTRAAFTVRLEGAVSISLEYLDGPVAAFCHHVGNAIAVHVLQQHGVDAIAVGEWSMSSEYAGAVASVDRGGVSGLAVNNEEGVAILVEVAGQFVEAAGVDRARPVGRNQREGCFERDRGQCCAIARIAVVGEDVHLVIGAVFHQQLRRTVGCERKSGNVGEIRLLTSYRQECYAAALATRDRVQTGREPYVVGAFRAIVGSACAVVDAQVVCGDSGDCESKVGNMVAIEIAQCGDGVCGIGKEDILPVLELTASIV